MGREGNERYGIWTKSGGMCFCVPHGQQVGGDFQVPAKL